MNKNSKITIETPCVPCKGTGRVDPCYGRCRNCGQDYDDTTSQGMKVAASQIPGGAERNLQDTLPCGCSWEHLYESDYCGECEGTGTIGESCTLEDLLKPLNEQIAELQRWKDAIYNSLNDGHKECVNIELGLPI